MIESLAWRNSVMLIRWSSLSASLILAASEAEATCNRSMKWGLESVPNHRELRQYKDENSATRSLTRTGRKLRAFRMAPAGTSLLLKFFQRHQKVVAHYRALNGQSQPISRNAFTSWAKKFDPYYISLGRSLAPVLYFDFVGESGSEYVLDGVDVQTFAFEEYRGGGFFDNKAWYDIELSKRIGLKRYSAERRLRFTSSGRADLRFFSNNYYPSFAMTPHGSFTISITFRFLRSGEECRVSTGQFMIDV